jgi:hypothetical protein
MSPPKIDNRLVAATWALASLLLPSALVGCGNPGEGTVRVSPEALRRLGPHVAERPKSNKLKSVAGMPLSIKERAASSKPQ